MSAAIAVEDPALTMANRQAVAEAAAEISEAETQAAAMVDAQAAVEVAAAVRPATADAKATQAAGVRSRAKCKHAQKEQQSVKKGRKFHWSNS
ncbi:MAG: hypothetical protein KGL35_09955 [Bradyrhizobium sp.]|nr:hypothetical protein [Bradyrhizobium sp.]